MTASNPTPCRHCRAKPGTRGRGLCYRCYVTRPIRERYSAETTAERTTDYGPVCRHCKAKKINRPRGLCWNCYYSPGVKERYPSAGKYTNRGVGTITGAQPPPAEPCGHLPGTEARIETYAARAAGSEQLWHPADRRIGGERA